MYLFQNFWIIPHTTPGNAVAAKVFFMWTFVDFCGLLILVHISPHAVSCISPFPVVPLQCHREDGQRTGHAIQDGTHDVK